MNLREAAEKLGISTATARRWIKTGRLEAIAEPGKYGQEYSITAGAVDKAGGIHNAPVLLQAIEPTIKAAELKQIVTDAVQTTVGSLMKGISDESNKQTQEMLVWMMTDMAAMKQRLDDLTERKKSTRWIRFRKWLSDGLARVSKRLVP
jgi:hypothetical protein